MEISNSLLVIHRNWLDLPRDVTLTIMKKLDVSEKLKSAQFVCKMWYILCKEPSLWRTIHIRDLKELEWPEYSDEEGGREMSGASDLKMVYNAIDRSDGGLVELDIEEFCTPELFSYALSCSSRLKRLRLACCKSISVPEVKEALEKLSCLEELELTLCFDERKKIILKNISSCHFLTTLKLNKRFQNRYSACDNEALAIAAGMPKLRYLQLIGNNMTDVGLTAILDGCPLLQSLDLRACSKLDLAGNLGKRLLEKIKDLRLPDDSTEEYKYKNDIVYYDDYDDYDDYVDADFVSDCDYDISNHNDYKYGFYW